MKTIPCKKCFQSIVFLKTRDGNSIPVNPESLSEADKHEINNHLKVNFDPKRHVSHFANCPAAEHFRKSKFKKKFQPQRSFFEKEENEF